MCEYDGITWLVAVPLTESNWKLPDGVIIIITVSLLLLHSYSPYYSQHISCNPSYCLVSVRLSTLHNGSSLTIPS
jgi:hypothetical protein